MTRGSTGPDYILCHECRERVMPNSIHVCPGPPKKREPKW